MIIVTLVATLAAAMVWQQWRAVQVEISERARAQAAWILSGALDFAKVILREDRKNYTALTEPWATPLAESRISTFLAVDNSNAADGPEAVLSGNIDDAQARYNLNNIVDADGKPVVAEVNILRELCEAVGVGSGTADLIATGLSGTGKFNAASRLPPRTIAQLAWLGLDANTVQALAPYVVLIDRGALVNVNTAPKEVLSAVLGVDPGTAENLLRLRQRAPFKTLEEFKLQVTAGKPDFSRVVTRSDYFEVRARLRLADRVLVERSLLHRLPTTFNVLDRERVASLEQVGG